MATMSSLAPYMQGIAGGKMPSRRMALPRVLIRVYRSRKGKSAVRSEDTYIGSGYADRIDRNVASADVEGLTTYRKERQYKLLRDIKYPQPDDDRALTFGRAAMGTEPLGSTPSPAPVASLGTGVQRGMLLEDGETKQLFAIEGITRDGDRGIMIHCGAERTF